MKSWIHNFFYQNRSTMNGLLILLITAVVYRFAGLPETYTGPFVVAMLALAVKFLTGTDNKPPTAPTV